MKKPEELMALIAQEGGFKESGKNLVYPFKKETDDSVTLITHNPMGKVIIQELTREEYDDNFSNLPTLIPGLVAKKKPIYISSEEEAKEYLKTLK